MSNGKDTIIFLIVGLIKKTLNEILFFKNESIFPKPFRRFEENINVKVDLWNYATKYDLKIANLASLKTEVDKLGIDKLAQVPVDLSKFSDFVKKNCLW